MCEYFRCHFDQLIHLHLGRSPERRPLRGCELEGTHSANSDVAEPLDGVEILGPSALGGEPRIDQCVAEFIRQ